MAKGKARSPRPDPHINFHEKSAPQTNAEAASRHLGQKKLAPEGLRGVSIHPIFGLPGAVRTVCSHPVPGVLLKEPGVL